MSAPQMPQSREAETSIIGLCMEYPIQCIPECAAVITRSDFFYDEQCRVVWEKLRSMEAKDVNMLAVHQELKENKFISLDFLMACQNMVISAANLDYWLDIAKERYTARRLIEECNALINEAYTAKNATALIDSAERRILAIRPIQIAANDIKSLVQSAITKIEQRCLAGGSITGLSTGLIDLDKLTDGLHKGEMVVVAGFPSTGKTALAVNIAVSNSLKGIPTAIFSAEMRPVQLVVRSICSESRVNFYRVTVQDVPKMTVAASNLSKAPLFIEQANRLSIGQITAIARRLKQKHDIQMAVVDYIQLLSGIGDNREQEISSISKGIKAMAMELEIPVLALSQLTDDGKLRESRAIGQDGDSIWKLENDGKWQHGVQPIKLLVEKSRDGATGIVNLTFMKEVTRFENTSKFED